MRKKCVMREGNRKGIMRVRMEREKNERERERERDYKSKRKRERGIVKRKRGKNMKGNNDKEIK